MGAAMSSEYGKKLVEFAKTKMIVRCAHSRTIYFAPRPNILVNLSNVVEIRKEYSFIYFKTAHQDLAYPFDSEHDATTIFDTLKEVISEKT